MALASYGQPRFLGELWEMIGATGDGGFVAEAPDWSRWAPHRLADASLDVDYWRGAHADLACSVQVRLEEVLVELARWVHAQTGDRVRTMAGGTALNCVANSRIWRQTPFEQVWVQPAAGDAGTSLGAALQLSADGGDVAVPIQGADLGRSWSDDELAASLRGAAVPFSTPPDLAGEVAEVLARNGVVAWFDGRSEFGPRALGYRSLLAHPGHSANLERLNDVKGREQFRPVAPAAQVTDEAQPPPVDVVVVDDRHLDQDGPELLKLAAHLPASGAPWPVEVLRSGGRGPAAARNAGWRSVSATWVVFLDDDVELPAGWARALAGDLAAATPGVASARDRGPARTAGGPSGTGRSPPAPPSRSPRCTTASVERSSTGGEPRRGRCPCGRSCSTGTGR